MVFLKVNCPEDHTEGRLWVQGIGGIVTFAGISNDSVDRRVGGRHGGMSLVVVG